MKRKRQAQGNYWVVEKIEIDSYRTYNIENRSMRSVDLLPLSRQSNSLIITMQATSAMAKLKKNDRDVHTTGKHIAAKDIANAMEGPPARRNIIPLTPTRRAVSTTKNTCLI